MVRVSNSCPRGPAFDACESQNKTNNEASPVKYVFVAVNNRSRLVIYDAKFFIAWNRRQCYRKNRKIVNSFFVVFQSYRTFVKP